MKPNLQPDCFERFPEVARHESEPNVYQVTKAQDLETSADHFHLIARVGNLLQADPGQKELDYTGTFILELHGRLIVASLGPRKGRPKDGPRGLHIRWSWDDDDFIIPLTPEEFRAACLGRIVEGIRADSKPVELPPELKSLNEFDALADALSPAERRKRELSARKNRWRGSFVSSRGPSWFEIPDPAAFDIDLPVGSYEVDNIVVKLLHQGRVCYSATDDDGFGETTYARVRLSVLSAARISAMEAEAVWQEPQHR